MARRHFCIPRLEGGRVLEPSAEPTLGWQEGRVGLHVRIQVGHLIYHRLAIVGPIRFKLEGDIIGLQNKLEVCIDVEFVLSEFLQMVYEKGRVGGRWQIVLEGLEDPVSYPCLWNSKGVLGRLNRRGIGNGEFRHGLRLLLGRALDKFAVAHDVCWIVVCL